MGARDAPPVALLRLDALPLLVALADAVELLEEGGVAAAHRVRGRLGRRLAELKDAAAAALLLELRAAFLHRRQELLEALDLQERPVVLLDVGAGEVAPAPQPHVVLEHTPDALGRTPLGHQVQHRASAQTSTAWGGG